MTWASQSMSHTVRRTREFLSRRLGAWPIIAVVLLFAIDWAVHGAIERTMNANLRSQLETLRNVEVAMLRTWLTDQENNAMSVACDIEVRRLTLALLEPPSNEDDVDSAALTRELSRSLRPEMNAHGYDNYFICSTAAEWSTDLGISERFASGNSPQIDGHLIHQALDLWSWFWTGLQTSLVFIVTGLILIATQNYQPGAITLIATLILSAIGLPAIRQSCKRYAIAQVKAIMADPTRTTLVRRELHWVELPPIQIRRSA